MPTAHILSLGTALPAAKYQQEEALEVMLNRLSLQEAVLPKIRRIYKHSAIDSRYTVLDDPFGSSQSRFFSEGSEPKMQERNQIYKEKALPLAVEAAKEALENWQGSPQEITHVISVSCTGIFAPGIEFSLIQELNLSPHVERLGINFMGCFGAFKGLAVASALALENPKNRVLLVCTELCSLHFQPIQTWDALISNALFSDGAAAAIVSSDGENPLFTILHKTSLALSDSFDEMQWDARDEGLFMKLSLGVPKLLSKEIKNFVNRLLEGRATQNECDFPLHPGGKAILEGIEKELNLSKTQTESSWKVLREHGNMSSATFLFVLQELLRKPKALRLPFAVGVGFGPGLAMEGILLKQ